MRIIIMEKLSDLIINISKLSGIKRIRYTTSHPIDFTDDLIKVIVLVTNLCH